MNAVFLSNDPDPLLLALARTMRDKDHFVFIVSTRRVAAVWRKHGFHPDVPGRGWLPCKVNDLDASSYHEKRNTHVIVMNRLTSVLERTMANASSVRPTFVYVNPGSDPPIPTASDPQIQIIDDLKRPSQRQLVSYVRSIVDLVASRN